MPSPIILSFDANKQGVSGESLIRTHMRRLRLVRISAAGTYVSVHTHPLENIRREYEGGRHE